MGRKAIGPVPGQPWGAGEVEGEHTSNPIYGPPDLYENGGFHGLAGRTDHESMRSYVEHFRVVKGRFVGNPLAGYSSGGGLRDAGE